MTFPLGLLVGGVVLLFVREATGLLDIGLVLSAATAMVVSILLAVIEARRPLDAFVAFVVGMALPTLAVWVFGVWEHHDRSLFGWVSLVLFGGGMGAGLLVRRATAFRSRPMGSRLCQRCGYDLKGLGHSGRCPECGTAYLMNIEADRNR